MKTKLQKLLLTSALLATLGPRFSTCHAQSTVFTYQGRLSENGSPASGDYEMQFQLYDAAEGGNKISFTLQVAPVPVSNGLFTASLTFGGGAFGGGSRWLEIHVRTNGVSTFTPLTPRQPITPAPYAIYSASATMAASVNSAGDEALELRMNNRRALRLEPTATNETINVIEGSAVNVVDAGVVGATIGGGGSGNYRGLPGTNRVSADFATIGGGFKNTSSGFSATVGGGYNNTIQNSADDSTIGGGYGNRIETRGYHSTIAGGDYNWIQSNAYQATISGGNGNTIQTNAYRSTIGGGLQNTIQTNAFSSTIGGGVGNTIVEFSPFATIPGGYFNTALTRAFAAGSHAKAIHIGAFVWGDSNDGDIASTNWNSVTMRASGGYRLFSNSGATAGVFLAPGGCAWSVCSDRNVKKDFSPVDGREVLDKLAAIPVSKWHYQWEEASVTPHLGPMAQDFKAAFYPGSDDKANTTQEADGVMFAAIQGLNHKLEEKLQQKQTEITDLKQRLEVLEGIIRSLKSN